MQTHDRRSSFAHFLREKIFHYYGGAAMRGDVPSQTRFGRKVDIPKGTLSDWLNQKRLPNYDGLAKLVRSREVGADALRALDILPAGTDPRIIELLDAYIQGKLSAEQLEQIAANSKFLFPDDEEGARAEAMP